MSLMLQRPRALLLMSTASCCSGFLRGPSRSFFLRAPIFSSISSYASRTLGRAFDDNFTMPTLLCAPTVFPRASPSYADTS